MVPEPSSAATGSGTPPRLVLPAFEGPLDLLLHLIRTNEIVITDIPIVEICRQYNAYLELMQELNLAAAGEYLLMASTLAHIKSRMLLPAPPSADGAVPEDPRAELIRQLVEYQSVKAAAAMLRERDEEEAARFPRGHAGEDPLGPFRGEALLEVSLFDLIAAFKRLVDSLASSEPLVVQRDEIPVAEKMAWVLDRLGQGDPVTLQALMGELASRRERIVAFLAVLELVRLRLARARQHRSTGEILLCRVPAEELERTERIEDDGPGH